VKLGALLMAGVVAVKLIASWVGSLGALVVVGVVGGLGIVLGWRWGRRSRLAERRVAGKDDLSRGSLAADHRYCRGDVDAGCGAANACLHTCSLCETDHPAVGG